MSGFYSLPLNLEGVYACYAGFMSCQNMTLTVIMSDLVWLLANRYNNKKWAR